MPYVMAVLLVVVLTGVAALIPSPSWVDRVALVCLALLAAWFLHRLASVRVELDDEGLTVVNLFRRRRLAWAEVVDVRLASGDPWMTLDLTSGDTIAAMGVQGADGERAKESARVVARAVVEHGSSSDR